MEGRTLLRLPRGVGQVTNVAWSPDGKKFAAVTNRGWLLAWYLRPRARFLTRQLNQGRSLNCVTWDRFGHALLVGDAYGLYRLTHLRHPASPVRFQPLGEPIRHVAWSPGQGRRCLIVAGHSLILAEERGEAIQVPYASLILDACWHPDGRTLAVVCADGLVEVFDREQQENRWPLTGIPRPLCVSWSPDGHHLGIGTWQGSLHLCSVPTAQEELLQAKILTCTRFPIRALAWGTDGALVFKDDLEVLTCVQEEEEVLPLASCSPTPTFALNGTELATIQRGVIAIAPF